MQGYEPHKIKGHNYWYLSPLREEKEASFKVNNHLNIWYDHGLGKGGRLVDLAIEMFQCTEGSYVGLTSQANPEIIKKILHSTSFINKYCTSDLVCYLRMSEALAA